MVKEEKKDNLLFNSVVEATGIIAKFHRNSFYTIFKKVMLPFVRECIMPGKPQHDAIMGQAFFVDLAEHCSPASYELYDTFVPRLLAGANPKAPITLRQCSVYGLGAVAQFGPPTIAKIIPEAIAKLHAVITHPESRVKKNAWPTENAISAFARILIFQKSAVDVSKLLPTWLSFLPVLADDEESPVTYGYLCKFIEENNPHIWGVNLAHVPHIVKIIVQVFGTDLVNPELNVRMRNILLKMKEVMGPQLEAACKALSPEMQEKVRKILSS
eukprot:TRINITY_DN8530_c0_g2_i2.p1 TRINITY_DN8530_c0_g2~~TRINITY_DN8530_c0_g2_i2.p1  ORF type:complete len:314 (+),score=14.73 TRINITY_DN8530_c0_g2_i2:131-943(+)